MAPTAEFPAGGRQWRINSLRATAAIIASPAIAYADVVISGPRRPWNCGLVNLFGIESPGLTASLAIADEAAAKLMSV